MREGKLRLRTNCCCILVFCLFTLCLTLKMLYVFFFLFCEVLCTDCSCCCSCFCFGLHFQCQATTTTKATTTKRERTTTCKQYLAVVRAFENRLEFVPLPLSLYSSLNYSVIHQPQLAVVVVRLHFTFRVFGFFSVRFLLLFVVAGSSV